MKLTVYFDSSYWYGLIEYSDFQNNYRAIKYLFGKEPKDDEIFSFISHILPQLITENDALYLEGAPISFQKPLKRINPKRMQRNINREKKKPVLSTKSQLAISESREQLKSIKQKNSKLQKEQDKQRKFELKQQKKYQKHKGH